MFSSTNTKKHRLGLWSIATLLVLGLVACAQVLPNTQTLQPLAQRTGVNQRPGTLELAVRWPEPTSKYRTQLLPYSATQAVITLKTATGSPVLDASGNEVQQIILKRESSYGTQAVVEPPPFPPQTPGPLPTPSYIGSNSDSKLNLPEQAGLQILADIQDINAKTVALATTSVDIISGLTTYANLQAQPTNPPIIESISPQILTPGASVSVTGSNFIGSDIEIFLVSNQTNPLPTPTTITSYQSTSSYPTIFGPSSWESYQWHVSYPSYYQWSNQLSLAALSSEDGKLVIGIPSMQQWWFQSNMAAPNATFALQIRADGVFSNALPVQLAEKPSLNAGISWLPGSEATDSTDQIYIAEAPYLCPNTPGTQWTYQVVTTRLSSAEESYNFSDKQIVTVQPDGRWTTSSAPYYYGEWSFLYRHMSADPGRYFTYGVRLPDENVLLPNGNPQAAIHLFIADYDFYDDVYQDEIWLVPNIGIVRRRSTGRYAEGYQTDYTLTSYAVVEATPSPEPSPTPTDGGIEYTVTSFGGKAPSKLPGGAR